MRFAQTVIQLCRRSPGGSDDGGWFCLEVDRRGRESHRPPHGLQNPRKGNLFLLQKMANEPPIDGGTFSWYLLAECMKNTKE